MTHNHSPRHFAFLAYKFTGLRGYCVTGETVSPAAVALHEYIDNPPKIRKRMGAPQPHMYTLKFCKHVLKKMYPIKKKKQKKKKQIAAADTSSSEVTK